MTSPAQAYQDSKQSTAVEAACAQELNSELTIILLAGAEVLQSMDGQDPDRKWILDMQQAAQRIAFKIEGLLCYAFRHEAKCSPTSFEYLIGDTQRRPR